jgi:hypothetical protein
VVGAAVYVFGRLVEGDSKGMVLMSIDVRGGGLVD